MRCSLPNASDLFRWPQFYRKSSLEGGRLSDRLLEFERLQQTINRWHGDAALLNLDNRELAQALQLVESRGEELLPNIAGLLLLGREESLRRFAPTHEVAFQVLDARGDVRMNDFFHGPLLIIIEEIQKRFDSRV
jgi:ATP-dependent DNA helicase RecG